MSEEKPSQQWRGTAGWALLIAGVIERVIGLGGSVDFVLTRSQDPGWVGALLVGIAQNIGVLMILAGVAFIVWSERRRTAWLLDSRLGRAPSPSRPPKPATRPVDNKGPDSPRVYLGPAVNVEFLVSLFEGRTSLEAQQAVSVYIGKWMRFTGIMADITTYSSGGYGMYFKVPLAREFPSHVRVWAYFDVGDPRLPIIRQGEIVCIEGRVSELDNSGVNLEDCELLKTGGQFLPTGEIQWPQLPPNTGSETRR